MPAAGRSGARAGAPFSSRWHMMYASSELPYRLQARRPKRREQPGEERGAPGRAVTSTCSCAACAPSPTAPEAIQRRHAQRRGEVAVRPAAGRALRASVASERRRPPRRAREKPRRRRPSAPSAAARIRPDRKTRPGARRCRRGRRVNRVRRPLASARGRRSIARASSATTLARLPPRDDADVDADAARQVLELLDGGDLRAPVRGSRWRPCPGSSPACAATPCTVSSNSPHPLRAVFSAPPGKRRLEHEHRRRTAAPSPRCSARRRRSRSPRRSSRASSIGGCGVSVARSASTADSAIAMPAFMSKVPGPWSRSPSRRSGIRSSVPIGQTVSKWPRSSTG